LKEYLVAETPFPIRRSPQPGAPDEPGARTVREPAHVVCREVDSVLFAKVCEELLVVHTLTAVKLFSLASRQLVRVVPVAAKRVRVWGCHIFCVCADEPPRVVVYDLVNEHAPAIVLECPEVAPTELIVRLLRGVPCLLACGSDRAVHVWHVPKNASSVPLRPLFSLTGHRDYVTCMEATDGEQPLVFTGSCDCTLGVWDAGGGPPRVLLAGHTDWIFGLALARVEGLLSCSRDATVRVWNTGNPAAITCQRVVSTSGSRALSHHADANVSVGLLILGAVLGGGDRAGQQSGGAAGSGVGERAPHRLVRTRGTHHGAALLEERAGDGFSGPLSATVGLLLRHLSGSASRHNDSVNSLTLRGDELLSAGDDGAVLVWRLPELLHELAPETPRKSGVFKGLKFKSPSVSK
jgi:WD40 repeat protein